MLAAFRNAKLPVVALAIAFRRRFWLYIGEHLHGRLDWTDAYLPAGVGLLVSSGMTPVRTQ